MIDFRSVRERVPAEDAARFYGLEFDRRGWAVCPFHQDKHPSISFKGGRFRCWACGANGDSLDLTARLFNLDSVQAAKKLDADFHLGLSGGNANTAEAERQESERRAIAGLHEKFETWRGATINQLNEVCYMACAALNRGPDFSPQEALSIKFKAQAEYLADLLDGGTPEQQAQIYSERGEIAAWTGRVLKRF